MSHLVTVIGVSGNERYLRDPATRGAAGETGELKRARRFRSEDGARRAAEKHIGLEADCIQRAMSFRVVEYNCLPTAEKEVP